MAEKTRESVPRKAIRMGLCVQILLMFVIMAAVNYISFNYYWRVDFSRSRKFSLTDQTGQALRDLRKRAKIYVITSPTARTTELTLYPDIRNLLKEFKSAAKGRISVEFVDPTRDPVRARTLQTEFKYGDNENLIILDYDGRRRFIRIAELGNFDFAPVALGQPPRLTAFRGEQILTDAIISVADPHSRKVVFLEENGEPNVENPHSQLSVVVDYARRQSIAVEPLRLNEVESIPSDVMAAVIVAPQSDIRSEDIEKLRKYWDRGGNLMVLLNPDVHTPSLNEFLSSLGILPEENRVLRIMRLAFALGIHRAVIGEFLPKAEPSKRLIGSTAYFPGATQSLTLLWQTAEKNQLQLRPLIRATEDFWGERDYKTRAKKGIRYDEGKDVGYPVLIAASAERGGLKDERVEVQSAKLVVVGNSDFAMNRWLGGTNAAATNLDFLLGCLNWLVDRGRLAAVVPKASSYQFVLNLTDSQLSRIALITMSIIPGVATLIGIFIWLRRRK